MNHLLLITIEHVRRQEVIELMHAKSLGGQSQNDDSANFAFLSGIALIEMCPTTRIVSFV